MPPTKSLPVNFAIARSKRYLALVWGVVQAGRRIDAPIGRDPADRKKMSARASPSREAVTRIVRAEHVHLRPTLAQVAIHTGRTHQIRVHLTAIGHPIVGDPLTEASAGVCPAISRR
jgi:23S rRNA pseudouridine1911/1915/1917 synthase